MKMSVLSAIATSESSEFLNSFPLSDRISVLPVNLQYTAIRCASTTVFEDLSGMGTHDTVYIHIAVNAY